MRAVRNLLIACAIVAFTVPALAQEKKADPHAKPATPEKKAEPAAKPATQEKKAEPAAKPAVEPEKKAEPAAKPVVADKPAAAATVAAIGKPAPDFTLKSAEGKDVKLADYKGKIVVLEWSNAGCPFCVRHAKNKTAEKTMAAYKDKGVVWVSIDSTDGAKADDIKKFVKDNGLTAAYLLDPTGATGKAYGAKTTPHMFIIDAKGNLAYSGAIDDDADGKKEKARNYVQEAVDALLKGSTVATATTESYGCSVKYGK
ncbi:MAG: redoxin domain-containing protein [Planctomycetota bacterium]